MIFKSFIFLLFFFQNSYANEILKKCNEGKKDFNGSCIKNLPTLPLPTDKGGLEVFAKWAWLKQKLEESTSILDAQINSDKDLLRFYRDDFVEKDFSRQWYDEHFAQTKKDYFDLRFVISQINILVFQVNSCYKYCSAYTRVEKEKELERLNALKLVLLARNPILASKEIEDSIMENDLLQDDKKFKKILASSYSQYLSNLDQQRSSANRFLDKENDQYEFLVNSRPATQASRQEYFMDLLKDRNFVDSDFISNFLSDLDWSSEIDDPVFGSVACNFYEKNDSYQTKKLIKDIGSEVAMFIAPFAMGPVSRLGIWGLRGAGLVKWGIRGAEAQRIVQSSTAALSGFYFLDNALSINELRKECNEHLTSFIKERQKSEYETYVRCHNDIDDKLTMAVVESSVMGFESIKNIKGTLNFFRNYDRKNNILKVKNIDELNHFLSKNPLNGDKFDESGFVFKSPEEGNFYALNLSHSKKSPDLKFLGDDYWNFVSEVYSRRLKLESNEIKDFIKSSKEMAYRTTLMVNTDAKVAGKFKGGVAFVTSTSHSQKMPLEKALDFEVKREKGKRVAEIVRLTVDEKLGANALADKFVAQLISTIKGEKDISKVYVFTSKVHARLYRKFGVPLKEIHKTDRDVVLEIDVASFQSR